MRSPTLTCLAMLIPALLFGCASSGGGSGDGSSGESAAPELPENVAPVVGEKVRVEWKNLNPRRQDPPLGLINRSSPEMKQLFEKRNEHLKPVDDEEMAAIVQAFREWNFFKYATEGLRLDSLSPGEAHGAITLCQGDRCSTMVFRPGAAGSGLPECYRDCKQLIIMVHRKTYFPRATQTNQDPARVFQVPQGKPRYR